jgi:argininosuccinate lyase
MPQKKNPDLLELVRGKSGRVIGHAVTLMVALKGLPLAYNKDLQETQEPVFDSAATILQMLPLVTGWVKAFEFNHDRMERAAQSGFTNAWAAATYLVTRGVASRQAHEQVGKAVRICLDKDCELRDLSLDELRSINPLFDQDFYESLSLASVLAIHDVAGGTAPAQVREAIAAAKKQIESLREEIHAHA